MGRFRYRMQNILEIKQKLETSARNEYAVVQARLNREEDVLNGLENKKRAYEVEKENLFSGNISVRELKINQSAIEAMGFIIDDQKEVIKRVNLELIDKREKLKAAMQERKMHEKLRENALESYFEEEKAAEGKSVDELTSYTYGKKEN